MVMLPQSISPLRVKMRCGKSTINYMTIRCLIALSWILGWFEVLKKCYRGDSELVEVYVNEIEGISTIDS